MNVRQEMPKAGCLFFHPHLAIPFQFFQYSGDILSRNLNKKKDGNTAELEPKEIIKG